MSLFHVELQEVIYRTYAVEAEDKAAARQLAVDGTVDEAVGHQVVSLLVTTAHLVEDACTGRDCYKGIYREACHVCCDPATPCPCATKPNGEDEFCTCDHTDEGD